MHTDVLPTHTRALFDAAVERAADALRAGQVVALPTETVYGLAANALDDLAVARIFSAKGRPAHNPIIVHVASITMARRCASQWPDAASRLARAFWPGPLTVVLPRAASLPDRVTAGGPTVGIRWPSHPLIQAVIRACGFPLAAPSANRSSAVSPTCAAHVLKSLDRRIPLVVDGGTCQVGIESTVVDLTQTPARLLRPGMIHAASIAGVMGCVADPAAPDSAPLRSPGLLDRHYAPTARLVVWDWADEDALRRRLDTLGAAPGRVRILAHTRIPLAAPPGQVSVIPHDPDAFGRALYAELHRADDDAVEWIIVEALPDTPAWRAIADRLRRASA